MIKSITYTTVFIVIFLYFRSLVKQIVFFKKVCGTYENVMKMYLNLPEKHPRLAWNQMDTVEKVRKLLESLKKNFECTIW